VLKYSLQNQVDFFIGEERGKILEQSKIHVMPTFLDGNSIEGFGISNVEASAYGLPCIVSSSGGTQESIIKNETGLVIQEKNVEQLYKAMKVLIQDEVKYMHMSSNSLKFAGSFLKETKVVEYLKIL
jgi:glycosyltransferase involved in cell wall biosynthesis